jgi:hypothetical protein
VDFWRGWVLGRSRPKAAVLEPNGNLLEIKATEILSKANAYGPKAKAEPPKPDSKEV